MTSPANPRAVAVHPRLRARRIAVQRAAGRRRLRRALMLGCAAAAAAVAWGAANSPLLDVDRITVMGATEVPASAVREASGVDPGTPLFSVDVGATERAVAKLPWVGRADVRRQWPGTVVIEISERVAVATARVDGGGWAVLDAAGRVLEVIRPPEGEPDVAQPPLPVLEGVQSGAAGATVADAAGGLRVLARLPQEVAAAVQAVGAVDGDVILRLQGGGVVRFGTVTDGDDAVVGDKVLDDKVLAMVTVLDKVDLGSLARLDVSVPGSPVLTRR